MEPDNYFESRSHYETYIEYRDPYGFRRIDNIKNAYHCEQTRETVFLTLYISQRWFPKGKPDVLEAQCQKITDANTLTEAVLAKAYWFLCTLNLRGAAVAPASFVTGALFLSPLHCHHPFTY
jgi:hypothetical protein